MRHAGGMFRSARRAALVALTALAVVGSPALADTARAARPQASFAADFFGISAGEDLTQLSNGDLTKELNMMQQAGVHWLRVAIPWGRVQHVQTYPDKWNLIDRLVSAASVRHLQIDGIVDNPPDWAKQHIPSISCPVQPPFNLTAYASFVGALAARYPASVLSAIELENSPNLPGVWRKPDPCAYTQLMKQAYPAIKKANVAVKVLNGGLGGTQNDATHIPGDVFFADLYKYGAKGFFDIVSFHPYSYPCFPSKACSTLRPWYRVPSVYQTMIANGDGAKKIWATEFGSPTNGTANDGHVSEQTQAAIMIDGMQQWQKYSYAGPFFVFQFRDQGTNPTIKNDWFGLVSHNLGRLKPSYTAYQELATG